MNSVMTKLSPGITSMIRTDHTHVLSTFHKYRASKSPDMRKTLVESVCLGLEIHLSLEEEIFYPALRQAGCTDPVLDESLAAHTEIDRLLKALRSAAPETSDYDRDFMALMRLVMHHLADEETVLLPAAETLLANRLSELGARMTKRRMQLIGPHLGEMAINTVRTAPPSSMLIAAGALVAGTYLVKRAFGRNHTPFHHRG